MGIRSGQMESCLDDSKPLPVIFCTLEVELVECDV